MNLAQALAGFVGRTVEAYHPDEFHVGVLLRVETSFFVIRETGAGYAPRDVAISFINVEHLRVRAAA